MAWSAKATANYSLSLAEKNGEGLTYYHKLRTGLYENGQYKVIHPTIGDKSDPEHKTRKVIDRVWDVYDKYTAIQLSNLAHKAGTPWKQIYDQYGGNIPLHTIITR